MLLSVEYSALDFSLHLTVVCSHPHLLLNLICQCLSFLIYIYKVLLCILVFFRVLLSS